MASPHHIAATGSGNKENNSENESTISDFPVLRKEVAFSADGRKKPAGFNLRKSIAWNPAFFTEEGVLDNSELSMLTGSELMANGSPSSGINGIMSPLCRSRRYDNTSVLKQAAGKSPGKLSAQHSHAENQGRRLFSSAKTPQRERKEPAVTQNASSARSFQKCIPRVPAGSAQRNVPNSASTSLMPRIPKKPLSSLPMAPKSTTSVTTVSKSNKKLSPVKTKNIHRVPGLLPKSKIASGHSMEVDVVPAAAAAAMHKETSGGSVKLKNPQISPSSFGGSTSTITKPSALRMPSPSVGFFNQENARMSHGNTAERNVGKFSARSTTSLVKPPRYKLREDPKADLHLSKVVSTNVTVASNLSLPVTTDSNINTLVTSEKRSLSKVISTYSAKSRGANYHERPEVYCLLARSGDTTQPLSSEKNDDARNSVPIVYKGTSPVENSLCIKATCFSTIEAACSSTKPRVGSKLSPSCVSSQRNDLSCQSKTGSCSIGATDLGKRALPVSLSEGESCPQDIDSSQNSGSCDQHNTECATSTEYALCADQMPPSDRNSVSNDSLYDEGEYAFSEEPSTEGGTKPVVKEDPLLQGGCEHKSSSSCISPQRNDLSCQSKTDTRSTGATDLENCYVGERALPISLCEAESCTLDIDSFQNSDTSDHLNTECATSMASVEYTLSADHLPPSGSSSYAKPALADRNLVSNDSPYDEGEHALSEEPNTDGGTELETNEASAVTEDPLLHVGCECNHSFKRCSPVKPEAPMTCVERQNVLSVELNMEDKMEFGSNKLPAQEGASHREKYKAVDRPRPNTILRDHLKNLVPFTEEWLAVMEACGKDVLEQKSGAVQNSPADKTAPEPSPWSPVKRKAQDVGPFDCTKYSKSVRTSGTP